MNHRTPNKRKRGALQSPVAEHKIPLSSATHESSTSCKVVPATVEEPHILCRHAVLAQLAEGYLPSSKLVALEEKRIDLQEMLRRTIEQSENVSALLIGPRGCGKSLLVRRVLADLEKTGAKYLTIHLNGHIHTDDNIALHEIACQLESGVSSKKSSHARSPTTTTKVAMRSFSDSLEQVLSTVAMGTLGYAVLFVLDEFDAFAQTAKKTLYNIFDMMHSEKAIIAIVGLTTRLDAVDLLEKRVKSRFSHRQIVCSPLESIEQCIEVLSNATRLPPDFPDQSYAERYARAIEDVLESHEFACELQYKITEYDMSPRSLFRMASLAFVQLDTNMPNVKLFKQAFELASFDSQMKSVHDLGVLELIFLVAMKRLEDKNMSSYNFDKVYEEYLKFVQESGTNFKYSRGVALKSFDLLLSAELVQIADKSRHAGGMGEHRWHLPVQLLVEPLRVSHIVKSHHLCSMAIKQWASGPA